VAKDEAGIHQRLKVRGLKRPFLQYLSYFDDKSSMISRIS